MYTQTFVIALLAAVAEARFGQEQGNGAIAAIAALSNFGQSGQAATLSGTSIQFLLAAANPCGKLTQADLIVSELGTDDAVIAAARGLVKAEQNFNPFVVSIPSICSDPTLPTTAALRGVVPLIDPSVVGSDLENANANASAITPFSADGLSVAQVMVAHGFSNFTAEDAAGNKVAASTLGTSASASSSSETAAVDATSSVAAVEATSSAAVACGGTTFVTVTQAATSAAVATSAAAADSTSSASDSSSTAAASSGTAGTCTGSGSTLLCTSPSVGFGAVTNAVTGNFGGFVASTNSTLDFGLCVPTMKFEAGLDGRATTESTFQAQDPLCNKGQEEALNPVIIANRIHDQLTNVCGANQAAKDAAAAAQTLIGTLGKVSSTADAWNSALGFAGTNLNPDNAPQTGLIGHV